MPNKHPPYKLDTRQREAKRRRGYLFKYGVSLEYVLMLYAAQKGLCPLCGKLIQQYDAHQIGRHPQSLALDHNHTTGQVRGVLHQSCNRALGFYEKMRQIPNIEAYLAGGNQALRVVDDAEAKVLGARTFEGAYENLNTR